MKNRRNYYRILHIQPDAPLDIVRASYRTQMQKLKMHPDLGGDEWNASVLNEAYRVLSNPARRAAYDAAFLSGQRRAARTTRGHADRSATRAQPSAQDEPATDMSVCAFCRTPRPADVDELPLPACRGCGGPLERVNHLRPAGTPGRGCHRMVRQDTVTFFTATDSPGIPARLRDLSPLGLQIQTAVPLRTGQVLRFDSDRVCAIGRVVYCNRGRWQGRFTAGIRFITVRFHRHAGTFISVTA